MDITATAYVLDNTAIILAGIHCNMITNIVIGLVIGLPIILAVLSWAYYYIKYEQFQLEITLDKNKRDVAISNLNSSNQTELNRINEINAAAAKLLKEAEAQERQIAAKEREFTLEEKKKGKK